MRLPETAAVVLLALVLSSAARADLTDRDLADAVAACDKSEQVTQIEISACGGYKAEKVERQLNRTYQALMQMTQIGGAPGDAEHLRKVQRAWVRFRELACESRDRGSMVAWIHSRCMQRHAEVRIQDLESARRDLCESLYCDDTTS